MEYNECDHRGRGSLYVSLSPLRFECVGSKKPVGEEMSGAKSPFGHTFRIWAPRSWLPNPD